MSENKLKVLDLFSGIGGFSLGLERTGGFETVAFCEIDPFCQKVLKKHWPDVPIYNDVRMLNYDGAVDLVTGGFPCQDISCAGKRAGIQLDEATGEATTRSGLFWENLRIFRMVGAKYWLMENVAEVFYGHLGSILGALAQGGNDAEWDCLSSGRLGRGHLRERFYCIAYASGFRFGRGKQGCEDEQNKDEFSSIFPAFPLRPAKQRDDFSAPPICRRNDGIPGLVHRLRQLGNTIDPEMPEIIGHAILNHERKQRHESDHQP